MREATSSPALAPLRQVDALTGAAIDPALFEALVDAFYQDLRGLARRERYRLGAGRTLCTTALVSEAWLKLRTAPGWNDQQHFMRTAALAMRQVLVNDAQARRAEKRNNGLAALPLESVPEDATPGHQAEPDVLALNEALERLEQLSPRLAQVVECRYFAGYSEVETAQALGMTDRTVRRDWVKARAWLYQQLQPGSSHSPANESAT